MSTEKSSYVDSPPPPYSEPGTGTYQQPSIMPPPQQQQQQLVTAVTMAPSGTVVMFPREPTLLTCQFCRATVTTTVEMVNGDATQRAVLILCILFGVIGALIPLCMDSTKDAVHKCPNCGVVLGMNPGQFC
ncbi:lipopolysaccharide-induced tumor necrosis factor-alpha factor homolog [Haliotis rubra]|uniref:lipopolysaccharide-induced tumor necrosis factor-alpha factor homolog n=1 Tax=Haliotis rubra TaxID=36100 RepID=UPI001EE51E69|nr:lipopolysaccharide-induced tumor necrosis factor-alpha factor homolog [Haliotis rubra]XP_046546156.1 lipopolysaccharide-induced tumor necrosis factor-alpha factor homolog [Haliotis rubra]XP_046546157.1 lipopolysaccharide-induced tumor necrosis factor-alpha factor homolog [Haliotis rubra]